MFLKCGQSPGRSVLQVRTHTRLRGVLQMPMPAVPHVHEGRKRPANGRRHFCRCCHAVQVVHRRVQQAHVGRVLGLDVVVMVVGKVVVASSGPDTVSDVEKTCSGSNRMFGGVVVVARFAVLDEYGYSHTSRGTLRRLNFKIIIYKLNKYKI